MPDRWIDPELSVVVPLRDEEKNVGPLYEELTRALVPLAIPYELILVEDGSADATFARLAEIQSRDPRVRVLRFRRNFGQTAAFAAGFASARGRLIATIDGDLQNDPADIPAMMRKLEETASDMVIGVRVRRQDTWSKKVQSRIGNGVRNWITKDQITDTGCSLKLVRREAVERVRLFTGMHRFLPTLVRMQGYKVVEMPVNHRSRKYGVSKYNAMNRAFRGLADCLAVRWMSKRMLKYSIREEI